jgi:hypothetical protein
MMDGWVIVCVHLKEKPIQRWNEIKKGTAIQGYLCDECNKSNINDIPASMLEPMSTKTAEQYRRIS